MPGNRKGPQKRAHAVRSQRGASTTHTFKLDRSNVVARGRAVVLVDLKNSKVLPGVLSLADSADVLVEGFMPGVMERLGLGPRLALYAGGRALE